MTYLIYTILSFFFRNPNFIKNVCVLAYLSQNPETTDTYYLAVLWGECEQYTFTSEYLTELSKHLIRMKDIDWSVLEEDLTMEYKIIEARKWKDTYIFSIIEEGKLENWVGEIKDKTK